MSEEKFGLRKEDQETIVSVLKRFPEIEDALIFGSRALGSYKQTSDIDLALKGNVENIYLYVKSILNEETLLPYNFDVLDYEKIKNKELVKHIDNFGKSIYKKSYLIQEFSNKSQ